MMAQRKLLAAALIVALPLSALAQAAAPAAAPAASVGLYGTLNLNLQTTRQQGVAARYAVSTDSSNVGVRAQADVAFGLKAVGQCETTANIDGIGTSGICNRNSRVGLSGAFGTLFYGNWDTAFKAVAYGTKADDPFFSTDVYGYQSIMSSPGFNYRSGAFVQAPGGTVGGFDVRAGNSVGYWSPKVSGLSAKGQWSVNESESANGIISPTLYSIAANYDLGPISLLATYERHEDAFALNFINGGAARAFTSTAANPTTVSSLDWGWRLGAGYELGLPGLGALTIGALFEQLTLGQDTAPTGALKEYKRWALQGAAKLRAGGAELRLRYNVADKGDCKLVGGGSCSTDGYAAHEWTFGAGYYFAPTAQVYLSYAKIYNDRNAQYTFGVAGETNFVAGRTARGSDPDALGLGIRYAF
jgi:predicted porin